MKKDFITFLDYSGDELTDILDRADIMADAWRENRMPKGLKNKQVGLWFYGNGFRNRLAFEIGAKAMGAEVTYIPGELGVNEPLEDVGNYLANWYKMLVVRAKKHSDLVYLSENTPIPVINARTEYNHPCEVMGDLQFIRRHRGTLDGLNVVFVGEVTNLCMSWFEAANRFPIKVTQVAPPGYEADQRLICRLNSDARGHLSAGNELESLLDRADLIYTDCFPKSDQPELQNEILKKFLPYQITEKHLARLKENALFLPCPPVTRGQEVSAEAMKSKFCRNFEAKDYLLHCQNAILEAVCSAGKEEGYL